MLRVLLYIVVEPLYVVAIEHEISLAQ